MRSIRLSLIMFCYFYFTSLLQAATTRVDEVIVTVNNEPILASDLSELKAKIAKNEILNDIALGTLDPESIKQSEPLMMQYLIRERILDSEVKRLNLSVTMERVEQELKDIAKRNGVTRAELPGLLEAQGIRFSQYQSYLKTRIEHQNLIDLEIISRLKVNDEELEAAYFEIFKKRPQNSFEVDLYHIFFQPKKKGGLEAARERADKAFALLKAGESFTTVAERLSEDTQFQKDGFLGRFQKEDLEPSVVKAIETTKDGLVPYVVTTKAGLHIFLIKNLKIIPDSKFQAQKEKLRSFVIERQIKQALERWFEVKLSQLRIEYFRPELKPQGNSKG
ncbi:MAG: peptidylprolyl isomerase [Bdellovibrionaceae bacterium]|nr:peptidylprolyl isomerase [Pseudobdellovibrionaceae bacterium]